MKFIFLIFCFTNSEICQNTELNDSHFFFNQCSTNFRVHLEELDRYAISQTEKLKKEKIKLFPENIQKSKNMTSKTAQKAKIPQKKVQKKKKPKAVEVDFSNKGAQQGLLLAYKKKTCLQLASSTEMKESDRKLSLGKMGCAGIDYKNFDPETNIYLKASAEKGLKMLADKFKK